MNDLLLQIQIFLRARYPILYLISHEEERVLRALKKVASTEDKQLLIWRSTTGISGVEGTQDPIAAFNHLQKQTGPVLLILLDFHHHISNELIIR